MLYNFTCWNKPTLNINCKNTTQIAHVFFFFFLQMSKKTQLKDDSFMDQSNYDSNNIKWFKVLTEYTTILYAFL